MTTILDIDPSSRVTTTLDTDPSSSMTKTLDTDPCKGRCHRLKPTLRLVMRNGPYRQAAGHSGAVERFGAGVLLPGQESGCQDPAAHSVEGDHNPVPPLLLRPTRGSSLLAWLPAPHTMATTRARFIPWLCWW